ncbi:MAG: DUF3500 domain-containing protein [Chloroflexota bacterium]
MKRLLFALGTIFIALVAMACGGGPPGGGIADVPSVADLSTCETAGIASQSSDENIEQLRQAMVAFRSSLSEELRTDASNCLDSQRFYIWHNTPNDGDTRHGIMYGELSDEQLGLFKALLEDFLSDDGYRKVDEITHLAEGFLNTINEEVWATDYYSIDMFGDPENDGSWGFQLDGHHVAVNFLVHGDSVSIVPAFLGSEPVVGTLNGVEFDVFEAERELAIKLYNELSATEAETAVSSDDDTTLMVGPAEQPGGDDPFIGDYDYSGFETGLRYADMSPTTQANLTALMQVYIYNLTTPFADVWWEEIMATIDDTYFVWISEVESPTTLSPIYYRIYNPHVWIEYNIEGSIGNNVEDGNHAHTITRIPSTSNGGDYGIFANVINGAGPSTLLEHYADVDHHALNSLPFDYVLAEIDRHHHHDD